MIESFYDCVSTLLFMALLLTLYKKCNIDDYAVIFMQMWYLN